MASAAVRSIPTITNPLLSPGEFLVSETERAEDAHSFDSLFEGSKAQMEKRWAASAVLDNDGTWHVVPASRHIEESSGVMRVRLYAGGVFGRSNLRAADLFRANAKALYM